MIVREDITVRVAAHDSTGKTYRDQQPHDSKGKTYWDEQPHDSTGKTYWDEQPHDSKGKTYRDEPPVRVDDVDDLLVGDESARLGEVVPSTLHLLHHTHQPFPYVAWQPIQMCKRTVSWDVCYIGLVLSQNILLVLLEVSFNYPTTVTITILQLSWLFSNFRGFIRLENRIIVGHLPLRGPIKFDLKKEVGNLVTLVFKGQSHRRNQLQGTVGNFAYIFQSD